MQLKRGISLLILLIFPLCLIAGQNLKTVYATNYPLYYFAKKIAGPYLKIVLPTIKGDPAFWKPNREWVRRMQRSALVLLNGAKYEKWLTYVSIPRRKLLDTSRSFQSQYILEKAATHSHGAQRHSHGAYAFTTWLNFNFALKQADAIKKKFVLLDPKHKAIFQKDYDQLAQALGALDQRAKKIVTKHPKLILLASHPVYQYFSQQYHVHIKPLELEPDAHPSATQWKQLFVLSKQLKAPFMLWENNPLESTSKRLVNKGIKVIVFNPCANRPKQGNFISVMNKNLNNLSKVLESNRNKQSTDA